ncbi:MAG TPA: hypothetical protein VFJ06_02285 [Halococcus sp.]|nr:hypothetical protein [Halococcus sp.]
MNTDIPEDVPHIRDVDPDTLISLDYVRDDDAIYHVTPNHEGFEPYDLVKIEDAD